MAEPAVTQETGGEGTDVHSTLKAYLEKSPALSSIVKPEEINAEELEILDYQQKRFGPNGDLMIQKKSLIQPILIAIYAPYHSFEL